MEKEKDFFSDLANSWHVYLWSIFTIPFRVMLQPPLPNFGSLFCQAEFSRRNTHMYVTAPTEIFPLQIPFA